MPQLFFASTTAQEASTSTGSPLQLEAHVALSLYISKSHAIYEITFTILSGNYTPDVQILPDQNTGLKPRVTLLSIDMRVYNYYLFLPNKFELNAPGLSTKVNQNGHSKLIQILSFVSIISKSVISTSIYAIASSCQNNLNLIYSTNNANFLESRRLYRFVASIISSSK